MSSDSEFDENAASDHQSEGEENGNEETEEVTPTDGQTNGENAESSPATWTDLVSSAVTCSLVPYAILFTWI